MNNYPGFDASKSYIGECQVCGNFQVVNDGHLVLHGYERPGEGHIRGRCWGEQHVPFELSCEVAKGWLARLNEVALPAAQRRLEALIANDPGLKLTIEVSDGYVYSSRSRWGSATTKTTLMMIEAGYVHTKQAQNDYQDGKTFEQFRQEAIRAQKLEIEAIKRSIAWNERKIASWKYAPEALRTRDQVKAEERAAKEEKAAYAKFLRNWKRLWKGVADAIQAHKEKSYWLAGRDLEPLFRQLPFFPTNKERAAARARNK